LRAPAAFGQQASRQQARLSRPAGALAVAEGQGDDEVDKTAAA
jgi:hypothetical protein